MPQKSQNLRSKTNQDGYQKRRTRKVKAQVSSGDVYEHIPEKTRRSNIKLDLARSEAWEFGVATDGATGEQREARLIGENVDDEEIDSEDDEELDSDEAFEESDEDRFAGFFSAKGTRSTTKNRKSNVRFAEVDLNEDKDVDFLDNDPDSGADGGDGQDEDEGDDDEFIDLVDVLDGKVELDTRNDKGSPSANQRDKNSLQDIVNKQEGERSEEDESDDEVNGTEDEQMAFAPSDEEEARGALDQLQSFVSNLDVSAKKRKASETDDGRAVEPASERPRKRRLLQETTEAGDENEFRVQSSGQKLQLDDLLAPLSGKSSALQALKKSTKVLSPGSLRTKPLSAPLPQRQQERLDREAAYEQTKEEIGKWSETMKRIREAEHLSFPLQAPPTSRVDQLELTAKFKPTTQLERDVDALLKAAKMRDEDIPETEDPILKRNDPSVEQIAQRRNELRKMRELMFRAEIKSRRVKKIKSKTYRRLRRKEKEHLDEKINGNTAEEGSETESRLKREMERAKERATLKHKHTGKWAKQMRNREDLDDGTRRDIEDMLARGDRLRRRIQGIASGESEGENGDDDDDDDDDELEGAQGIAKIKQDAFSELAQLESKDTIQSKGKAGTSVFDMKFMKEAMARKASVANKEVDDFIKEMGGDVGHVSDEAANEFEEEPRSGVVAVRSGGRVVYRPASTTCNLPKTNSFAPSDTSSVTLQSTDLLSPPSSPAKHYGLSAPTPVREANPWLIRDERLLSKGIKTKNSVVVSKESKAIDKAQHRLSKQAGKHSKEHEKAQDELMEISMDNVLRLPVSASVGSTLKTHVEKVSVQDDEDNSGVDSEVEAQERALVGVEGKANGLKSFEQRELVALAFAGDNVVQSFEDTKRGEIAADAPREVDTTIPGWGSWGGAGIKKAPPKPQRIKKISGIDPTTRADYQKKNLIISEKRDKKAAKYLIKDLPYPYTNKAQFDRAMDIPIGTEWNTRLGFQRGTLPRVVKKPGIVIEPLHKFS